MLGDVQLNLRTVQEPTIKGAKYHPRLSESDRRGLVLGTFGSAVARKPVRERPSFPLGWQDEGVAVPPPRFFRSMLLCSELCGFCVGAPDDFLGRQWRRITNRPRQN